MAPDEDLIEALEIHDEIATQHACLIPLALMKALHALEDYIFWSSKSIARLLAGLNADGERVADAHIALRGLVDQSRLSSTRCGG